LFYGGRMKKEFIGYVLALTCAGIYLRVMAAGQTDPAMLYKSLEDKLQARFEQEKKSADLPGALLLLSLIADDAVQKGAKAPDYNLCDLGTICHDNKGIKRVDMPQLGGKPVPGSPADKLPRDKSGEVDAKEQFGQYLVNSKKYMVTEENVPVSSLKATQDELVGAKVAGIYLALQDPNSDASKEIKNSYLYISSDSYVLDGHHRWVALLADAYRKGNIAGTTIKVKRIGAPISDLVKVANQWAMDFGVQAKPGVATQPAAAPAK
jgi:hypothetical protein